MAVTVAQIIEGARTTHESFHPEAHPSAVCLSFLSRYQRQLVAQIVRLDPMRLASIQEILKATWVAGWDHGDTGVAALANHIYLNGMAYMADSDSWDVLRLAAFGTRPREYRQVNDSNWPAYAIVNGKIFFHGAQVDWDRYASVDIYYVPMTAALTIDDSIVLPDSAEPPMVAGLAYHLSQRSTNSPGGPDPVLLRKDWADAERIFVNEISQQGVPKASATLDVW